ncbi:MAG: CBS domain-containing protein [Candidatus Rokubacteria bacterium]|nr:CBS domain-containing protein [Candidatus Rokubacteria bacterium]
MHLVRDVMTEPPIAMSAEAAAVDAARVMSEAHIGCVIVVRGERLVGIVTDRDIVVRGLAQQRDPARTTLCDLASRELVTVSPDERVSDVVRLMAERAIRRLPVVADGRLVGIVTLGDLALERDRRSALGEISAAPANR